MKKITTLALGLLLASAAFAQKGNKAEVLPSLQSTLGKHFLIGVAVDTRLPAGQDPAAEAIVKEQFNQVVAENCMKEIWFPLTEMTLKLKNKLVYLCLSNH